MRARTRIALGIAAVGALTATLVVPADAQSATTATTLPPAPSCTSPSDLTDPFLIPAWTDTSGWQDPSWYTTIMTGDVSGDGRTDLLARNSAYVEVNEWAAGTDGNPDPQQWMPGAAGPSLPDSGGWDAAQYYSTIQLADLDGNGTDELIARASGNIAAWTLSGPDITEGTWNELPAGPAWSDTAGWNQVPQYSSIRTGDVDGNGTDDVVGLAPGGSEIVGASYDGASGSWIALPTLATGFVFGSSPEYYQTIQLADVDGNGTDEVVGRTSAGILAWTLANGTWTELPAFPSGQGWSDANDWNQPEQYGSIRTADVDGDGAAEVLGLSDTSLETYGYDATSGTWSAVVDSLAAFPAATWSGPEYYSTLQFADVTGDGADDMLARGPGGLLTYTVSAGAWQPAAQTFSELADGPNETGWNNSVRYPTIHSTPLTAGGPAALFARTYMGVETWVLSGSGPSATWVQPTSGFPDWAVAPIDTSQPLERAYQYINDSLGKVLWPQDVLPADPSDPGTHYEPVLTKISTVDLVAEIQANLPSVAPEGLNITRDEWDQVQGAVSTWLTYAGAAGTYLLGGGESVLSLASDQLMQTSNILQQIEGQYFDIGSGEEILAIVSVVLAAALAGASSVVDPEELPLLAAGLALSSSGLSSWQGFANPQAAIQTKYDQLLAEIDNDFCTSVYYLTSAYGQITADYGLLTTVGQLLGDQVWGWTSCPANEANCNDAYAAAVSAMDVSQQIWAFQQFGSVAWRAGHCEPDVFGDFDCDFSSTDTNAYLPPIGENTAGPVAWKVVGTLLGGVDCVKHTDTAIDYLRGTLGVDLADIFAPLDPVTGQALASPTGSKGWKLKVDNCD